MSGFQARLLGTVCIFRLVLLYKKEDVTLGHYLRIF